MGRGIVLVHRGRSSASLALSGGSRDLLGISSGFKVGL